MNRIKTRALASGVAVGAAVISLAVGGCLASAGAAILGAGAVNSPADAPSPGAPGSFPDIVAKVSPAVLSVDVVRK